MIYPINSGVTTMKLRYLKFPIIALLSIFLIVFPALSQSRSYAATINRFGDSQVGQTIRASTANKIADGIYAVIRPSSNPLPKINISLGTVSLNKLQETIRSKGVSAKYYEYIQGGTNFKDPWNPINVSSLRASSKVYGVSLSRKGYSDTEEISFKVTAMQGGSPALRFDRSSVSLVDGTKIDFTIEAGNSGINPTQIGSLLSQRDSRLHLRVLSDLEIQDIQNCRNQPQRQQQCTIPPDYSIKLSGS
jgi:hypothetical protein